MKTYYKKHNGGGFMDVLRSSFSKKRIQAAIMTVLILVLTMAAAVPAQAATNLNAHLSIGYWLGGNGGTNKTLRQMDPQWDVINVSFLETAGNYHTPNLNMDLQAVYSGTKEEQEKQFKKDIKYWQDQGKKIVLSCGGQNGVVELRGTTERNIFLAGLKTIIEDFGFDGFDVDFEGGSIAGMGADRIGNLVTQQSINLSYILNDLRTTYGEDFIISAAPEYIYVQGGAIGGGHCGAFLPLLDDIREILTYIHPQYYNGFNGDFAWLDPSAGAGAPFAQVYSAEGYRRLSEMLITGFQTVDKGYFTGLRPDQVAFGVPARTGAGNGAQPVSVYARALNDLLAEYPDIRGVMTWSIGWDETGGNQFINTIDPIIEAANNSGNVQTDAQTPAITTQPNDLTVAVNGGATLTVAVAVSRGTLSYQWYNGNGTPVGGATGDTFNPPTGTVGTSAYYCVVTNTDDTATGNRTATAASRTALVTVSNNVLINAEVPLILIQPTHQTVNVNDNATLTVIAYVSKGVLSYQWYTDSHMVLTGETGTAFNPPTGTSGTSGYYCVVTNTDSTATGSQIATVTSNTATVTVNPVTGFPQWQSNTVYVAGNIVIYNGVTYRCKWWTLGNIPGTEQWGPWEVYP